MTRKRTAQVVIRATGYHSISGQGLPPIDIGSSIQINCPQNAMKVQVTGEPRLYLPTLRRYAINR